MLTGLLAAPAAALRSAAGAAVATCATVAAASVGLAVAAAAIGLAVAATAVGPPSPPPPMLPPPARRASAPPPFYPYYLADPGVQTCPTGSSPMNSNECDTAAQEILSKLSLTAARTIQVNEPYPELRQRHRVGRSASRLLHSIGDHHSSGVGGTDHSGRQHAALEVWANPPSGADGINCAFHRQATRSCARRPSRRRRRRRRLPRHRRRRRRRPTTSAVAAAAVAAAAHAAAAVDPAGGAVRQPGRAPATAVAATAATAAAASHATAARGAAAVAASAHAAAAVAAAARDPRRARGV